MALTRTREIVNLKNETHFNHENENERIEKYTLGDKLPLHLSNLSLRPKSMSHAGYDIRVLTEDDKEAVIDFLRRFFFRDEPMNKAVKLLETPHSRCVELEDYSVVSLKDGVSVAAVDEDGCLVGVLINGIVRRQNTENNEEKDSSCPNKKFQKILQVLEHLDKEAKIWGNLPESCQAVIEIRIASTHDSWRGRGLMRALCDHSERLALMYGATAARMDATSAFSAAAAERLKYKNIYSVKYADLPFAPQPEEPHTEARVYIKELS